MRVLIIGLGLVGQQLATKLVAAGHHVTGSTTTPAKVDGLQEFCSDVVVLVGSDTEAVRAASADKDVVIVCAGPSAERSATPEERALSYKAILVDTAEAVVAAVPATTRVIALSSLSVYGAACDDLAIITEESPVTDSPDPSPANFIAMEKAYLGGLGDRATVFRCGEIFGAGDPPLEVKVAGAHQFMGGSVPFRSDALFYRVHVDDVVAAIEFALDGTLTGLVNLTHEGVPQRNAEIFDTISLQIGKPKLEYRNEIESPAVPISTQKLRDAGFTLTATPVTSVS